MKSKQSPDTLFDALALGYETMRKELAWNPFTHIEAAFDGVDLRGMEILDAGCGTGECTRWFAEQGASPIGIDISGEMCFHAAEMSENIMYLQHDLRDPLPFASSRFDAVVALGCLEYIADIRATVEEFYRTTKPGGMFLGCFERFGDDCPGKNARQVVFFDEWMRYRQSRTMIESMFAQRYRHVDIEPVAGFLIEETGETTQYWRVIAKDAMGMAE